ncbi:MAG: D-alanine--D-alanine ligase [Bacteroidota bacterium]
MKKVAVIAGGDGGEFEVSLKSAEMVYDQLDPKKYEPYLVLMQGSKWRVSLDGKEIAVDRNDFSFKKKGKKIIFNVAFIAIHGSPGEDGKLQGYFDLIKLPYTACNTLVSALTFNKYLTKQVVGSFGLPMAKAKLLRVGDSFNVDEICKELKLPIFVKPNNNGSSVGVTKVKKKEDLIPAIVVAFQHDTEVLVEAFMPGREMACGVFRDKDNLVALPLCEIVSKREFFDYEAKYTPGMADELVPAPVTVAEEIDCKEKSLFLYDALGCKGIVRFDYILNKDGVFQFLEVNTIPGLGKASIVPKMVKEHGWKVSKLFTKVIENSVI